VSIEWIVIETLAVLVENFAFMYFLHNRFNSKVNSKIPAYYQSIIAWCVLVCWGLIATFTQMPSPIYDSATCAIILLYLLLIKSGTIWQKILSVILLYGIDIGTSIAGAGFSSFFTSATIEHALQHQDTSRLLAIVFIKMLQIVLFYILAKRHNIIRDLQRKPLLVLSGAAIADFFIIIITFIFTDSTDLSVLQSRLIAWLAVGALIVMIAIFLIYELFIREEVKNVELATKLQRLELETKFFNEIDVMYKDMREWRHGYKNNLSALRALVAQSAIDKALNYIDDISDNAFKNDIILKTGNRVLDAVVSSKLRLAQSLKIEINIQSIYPENNQINDADLCAIIGNLLDNSIEACERMNDNEDKKFIDFTLALHGKDLFVSISNSYSDKLNRDGDRYLTIKKEKLHGIGISHVDSIVDKYHGHVVRTQNSGIFETRIMLPLTLSDSPKGCDKICLQQ